MNTLEYFVGLTFGPVATKEEQEARWARESLADRAELTDAERDHWSAILAEEATCEGRHHRSAPINPHD